MRQVKYIHACVRICFNPLNAELNPIRHLLALVGARHIVHVSRIWVNIIYIAIIKVVPFPKIESFPSSFQKVGICPPSSASVWNPGVV